jgi:hypothetical protein
MELFWPPKKMMELHMSVWSDILCVRKQVLRKDLDRHSPQL